MKYRLPSYSEKTAQAPQSFTCKKDSYIYDEHTNELIKEDEPVDLQALVQSSEDTCLDKIIERFGINNALKIGSQCVSRAEEIKSECDAIMELMDILDEAEELREKLGLPVELDTYDVFKAGKARHEELLKEIKKISSIDSAISKEVKNLGTETQDKQAQSAQDVSQNSEQSPSKKS